ncbi:hypothetical protein F4561_002280 [Lipingzhangella halophila]|uniref:ARB-07466-like C-terminal domain-containing protein n=1 Tax=Lipingzhangella halophila TaxID=1783352 RepID=A0A7W7RGH8_9ACTN|nr:hypothetical protein [Lipingzhangella halophila]MBB4931460.1 hypothetical protein [Lipingzhangella halophila]
MRETGRRVRKIVVVVVVLTVIAAGVVWGVPRLLERVGVGQSALPWADPCSVDLGSETISLSREEAKRATTATALRARSEDPPDTSAIDPAVLERLADGPRDDAGPSLTCRVSADNDLSEEEMTGSGLTPRAERVRAEMAEVFGEQDVGGFAPGGIDEGHGEDSAHYDGRAIDVFYRPVNEENRRAGWLLAHWLVAHAAELDIAVVIFDDRIWSALGSPAGWRDYNSPDPDNEILRHLDHVHVDVQQGN